MEILAAPSNITDCNCSICRRLGALWAYYKPGEGTVAAQDATDAYTCHGAIIAFNSCRTCGCTTHWSSRGTIDRIPVKARLMHLDFRAIPARRFDGDETWKYLNE
jgi:hypothetical protein